LKAVADRVDHTALVLPFEEPLYRSMGIPATFVGHPLLDETLDESMDAPPEQSRTELRSCVCSDSFQQVVAFLPGSRATEIRLMGPVMIDAAAALRSKGIRAFVAPGDGLDRSGIAVPKELQPPDHLSVRDLLRASDAAIVASGTATLEAVLADVPLAIVYKTWPLNYAIARALVKVPYIGLPNWILSRKAYDELLQDDVCPSGLLSAVDKLLDPAETLRQKECHKKVRNALGKSGAAKRVARLFGEMLDD